MIKILAPMEIKELLLKDDGYPSLLKTASSPPPRLYVKGQFEPRDALAVAIVGSRDMTAFGKAKTKQFVKALVKENITIVSGMARGVDTEAHLETLKNGGRTIAVMGSGLDVIYPAENLNLYKKIVKNGAVVTEFEPGTKPMPANFLARNRIIAGLSLAVVVIEGKRKSGTLSTAAHAASEGREVFAVAGATNAPMAQASRWLIQNGAQVANSADDVLEYLSTIINF